MPYPRLSALCVLAAVATPLLVSGCAAKPDWTKPGVSKDEIERDWTTCQDRADRRTGYQDPDESKGLTPSQRRQAAEAEHRTLDACMRNLGYFPLR